MIIAVDFDGTIVEHAYPKIGREKPFAISTLKKLQQDGHHQLVLWTVREGDLLREAVEFCKQRGLEFYAVNSNYPEELPEHRASRKISADLFIDDCNLGGIPDWGIIYRQIMSGDIRKPYSNEEPQPPSLWKKLFG
ncbi:MAG TPA: hypothetical protein DEO38_03480 [Bacteroidales bacterium]|jgi:hypothetical protein|nr:hypothetical protein [Bacteroidales bacterium]